MFHWAEKNSRHFQSKGKNWMDPRIFHAFSWSKDSSTINFIAKTFEIIHFVAQETFQSTSSYHSLISRNLRFLNVLFPIQKSLMKFELPSANEITQIEDSPSVQVMVQVPIFRWNSWLVFIFLSPLSFISLFSGIQFLCIEFISKREKERTKTLCKVSF